MEARRRRGKGKEIILSNNRRSNQEDRRMEKDDIIEKELENYHGTSKWSMSGLKTVEENRNSSNGGSAKELLANSDIYTRCKRHRRAKVYSPIYVYKRRELFQADTVFFTEKKLVEQNDGYKYAFTVIDVFSKMAWVYPLKSNTCEAVMNCLKDVFSKCGKPPDRLNTDRGSELICKPLKQYLKEMKIFHYLSYSLRKCPVIERFNLTLQNILYRLMSHRKTLQWTSCLQDAMKIYLNRKHSTVKMSPLEADKKENEKKVREHHLARYSKMKKKKAPKFSVGDTVRIWKKKSAFERGYAEAYTKEHFTVAEVMANLRVPQYVLKDSADEVITGAFFGDELVKYTPAKDYEIQVLKTRGRGKKKQLYVHYVGFPEKMDAWIPEAQLS